MKALNKLKIVNVKGTKVTPQGASNLMEAVPKVVIFGIKEWETGYIRVEMQGVLLKEVSDKKEQWFIKVKTLS